MIHRPCDSSVSIRIVHDSIYALRLLYPSTWYDSTLLLKTTTGQPLFHPEVDTPQKMTATYYSRIPRTTTTRCPSRRKSVLLRIMLFWMGIRQISDYPQFTFIYILFHFNCKSIWISKSVFINIWQIPRWVLATEFIVIVLYRIDVFNRLSIIEEQEGKNIYN